MVIVNFDRREDLNPNVVGSAEHLSHYFPDYKFGIILADPPYSTEDSEHYGCTLIKQNTVIAECHKALVSGGVLVWLDQV